MHHRKHGYDSNAERRLLFQALGRMETRGDSGKCRCSVPTSVQSASNLGCIIWPLRFSRSRRARLSREEEWNGRRREEAPVVATPRLASKEVISARRHYSSRPVQPPLFLDRESIPGPGVQRPRPFPPRACINHETPGILSRQCETSVIPPFASLFIPLILFLSLSAIRSVMLLSSRLHSFCACGLCTTCPATLTTLRLEERHRHAKRTAHSGDPIWKLV